MALSAGDRLGAYDILEPLGAGGMGEVYRATDTKLGREVAIKVLPTEVARDAERLGRFRREAQLLAALNHTGIGSIHGLEESDGNPFLVLELVEGEDLKERLGRGAIPLEEALEIAQQIAEALEEAHEKGIVHRDLKPANVKLTSDGKVKVLDFGLAKAYSVDTTSGSTPDLSQSPTLAHGGTAAGLILGTAAYMAPEQARGKPVDKRADIWAFGVLLWEMLTGQPLFSGETVSDVLAGVLTRDPDWTSLSPKTPTRVRGLLGRCLERDPRRRLRDIGEARVALTEDTDELEPVPAAATPARGRSGLVPWAIAALAVLGAAAWTLFGGRASPSDPVAARFALTAPPGTRLDAVAISPNGRRLVFVGESEDGERSLWIRELDSTAMEALSGTERAEEPFWSPDSSSVGFFADEKLKTLDLANGSVETLCAAREQRGGHWAEDGSILFASAAVVLRVPATGGTPEVVTRLDPALGENSHRYPHLLPDREHFVYFSRNPARPERTGVWLWSLRTGERKHLAPALSSAVYAEPGFLLFRRGQRLMAQRLDPRQLELVGDPATVANDVWFDPSFSGRMSVSVSRDGTLVFRTGGMERSELVWLDREGALLGRIGEPGSHVSVDVSIDGRRVAFSRAEPDSGERRAWLYNLDTETASQLTFEGDAFNVAFSPDAERLAVTTSRGGGGGVEELTPGGSHRTLIEEVAGQFSQINDWAPDGRHLLLGRQMGAGDELVLHDLQDDQVKTLLSGGSNFMLGAVSPDGRWLAYTSDITGEHEVYVARFDDPSQFQRISSSGGQQPRWEPSGKELFYLKSDRTLMAVPILRADTTFEWSPTLPLFPTGVHDLGPLSSGTSYDVAPGGRRFLVSRRLPQAPDPAAAIVHWASLAEEIH